MREIWHVAKNNIHIWSSWDISGLIINWLTCFFQELQTSLGLFYWQNEGCLCCVKAEAALVIALAGEMVVHTARCGDFSSSCEFRVLGLRIQLHPGHPHPASKHPTHNLRKHRVHITDTQLQEHPHQDHLIGKQHAGLLCLNTVLSWQLTCVYIRTCVRGEVEKGKWKQISSSSGISCVPVKWNLFTSRSRYCVDKHEPL